MSGRQMSEKSRWRQMSGDKCLKIHVGVKCHLVSNVTRPLVIKCLWPQMSQPLIGLRGPASNVRPQMSWRHMSPALKFLNPSAMDWRKKSNSVYCKKQIFLYRLTGYAIAKWMF